jgi:hypothetical protein
MSDEPVVREREPIERVRARLEALVRASAAPRCGARSKRTGKPCRGAAMPNGRCKVHGGKSTGPRAPEGLERSRWANWKHGHFSREAKAARYLRSATCAARSKGTCGRITATSDREGCRAQPLRRRAELQMMPLPYGVRPATSNDPWLWRHPL